jgi:hypothetical protein
LLSRETKAEVVTDEVLLRSDLTMHHPDFVVTNRAVWLFLHAQYGGGPLISRRCFGDPPAIELHLLCLTVYKSSHLGTGHTIRVSRISTVGAFKAKACAALKLDPDQVRVMDFFHKQRYAVLNEMGKTLAECHIHENNDMLLEEQHADGTWPPLPPRGNM